MGNRTWTAKGGLAVFAHQASSNPYYGRMGIELLAAGLSPEEALDRLVKSDDMSARRQVAIIDIQGRTAAHTGSGASDWKGHKCGENYCAQGNTLAGPEVVESMARTFEATEGQPLAERLRAREGDRAARQEPQSFDPRAGHSYWGRAARERRVGHVHAR